MEEAERLSVLLATVPADTRDYMAAQMRWFEEDLGVYIKGKADPAFDQIFETLPAGLANFQSS